MNWSVYSRFVGNVFGAPLAIEGLAAFFLESTFLGLWIFGWNTLSPRLHLATLWIAVAGTWLSAYFILVANSFMQDPVGYKIVNGEAQLTSVWALISSEWALYAFVHTLLAGLTAGAAVVFGVCCWHMARGRNVERLPAGREGGADLPGAGRVLQPWLRQPLRDPGHPPAADEDLGQRGAVEGLPERARSRCSRSAASPRATRRRPSRSRSPACSRSWPPARSTARSTGLTELNQQYEQQYGSGNYVPPVRGDLLEHAGDGVRRSLIALIGVVGAILLWRKKLERLRWFLWFGVIGTFLPFVACIAGWCLTEIGRQPWVVQGLLKTNQANSPTVTTTWLVISLTVFLVLYGGSARRRLLADAPLRQHRSGADREPRSCPPSRRWGTSADGPADPLVRHHRLLLGGLLHARGVRLRRRHAAPVPAPGRGRAAGDVRVDRPGLGRQRGLAGGGRRRDLRGLPGLVRVDVLGLLPGAAAGARVPDRARPLVRVADARARAPAGGASGRGPTRPAASARRWSGESAWRTCCTACRSTAAATSPAASGICSTPTRCSAESRSCSCSPSTARPS